MAGKGARAGKAFVEMSLQDDPLRQSLRGVAKRFSALGGKLRSIGGAMAGVGAGIAAPFAASLKIFSSYGDQLDKMSLRTGLSVESLSQLGFAAEQSGASIGVIEKGAKGMQKSIRNLERGTATAVETYEDLGLSFEQIRDLSPEDQFTLLADRVSGISDPTRRAAVAMEVFGRAGSDLLPLLNGGAGGISALRAEADALGLTMGKGDTDAAAAFTDALNRLFKQGRALFMQLAAAVAGPLTTFLSYTQKILADAIRWGQANRGLIATVAAVGAGILFAGSAVFGLGVAFQAIAFAAVGLAGAITTIVGVLATIVSPIGLVVAGIGLGTAAFLTFTETGQNMVDRLLGLFGDLKDTALRSFSAISQALAAGDIQAAGEVLWAGLQLLWLQGTAGITDTWHKAIGGIAKIWHSTWSGMLQLFNYVGATIGNVWDRVMGGLAKSWNYVAAVVQKGWAYVRSFFDGSIDYATEAARIDAELTTKNAGVDANSASSISRRDQAYADRLDQIGADLAAKLSRADDGTEAAIKAAEATLADAKSAFAEAETAALASGQAAEAQVAAMTSPAVEEAGSGTVAGTSAGLFNAAGIGALFRAAGGPEEQTAKATERTAKATEALLAVAQEGATFA